MKPAHVIAVARGSFRASNAFDGVGQVPLRSVVIPIMLMVIGWVFKMVFANARQKRLAALQGEMRRKLAIARAR